MGVSYTGTLVRTGAERATLVRRTYALVFASVVVTAGSVVAAQQSPALMGSVLQHPFITIIVMFGSSYTFKRNEHVRVEIFYLFLSERAQLRLDLIGTLFFLIPACLLLAYLSWPFFMQAYNVGEMSGNAGGLLRWPIKFVIPSGFVMLALQGVSEVIKRIAALRGEVTIDAKYERPTQ